MTGDRKNPWDRKTPDNKPNPWSSGGGEPPPPDLEELLRKAQDNFFRVLPGYEPGGLKLMVLGILILAALWFSSGFYLVSPGENAVITRFGAWTKTQTDPGLGYHLPWPVESAQILNVTVDRRLQIGFSDGGSRLSDAKRSIPEESQMLTADANIIEIQMVVLWNIENAKDYVFNIRDQEQTIKKVATSALREVVGQSDLWPMVTGNRSDVQAQTQKIMQDVLDSYKSGISVKQVVIEQATVHPDVTEAFEDVMAASQDAMRYQNEANIYRNDIVPKARGQVAKITQEAEAYKASVLAKAQGDAARFNSVYASYLGGKDVTRARLYIETMEQVMGSAQKIIVDRSAAGAGIVPYMPLNELKPAAGGNPASSPSSSSLADMPPPPAIVSGGATDQKP